MRVPIISKMLNNILNSRNFLDLAENLDEFIDFAHDNCNEQIIYEKFYYEVKRLNAQYNQDFNILTGKDSVASYLLTNWTFRENSEDNYRNLLTIVMGLQDNYLPPRGEKIDKDVVVELLDIVEQKYGFCTKVLKRNPISILLINNTLKGFNGLCSVNREVNNEGRDTIILTHVADNRVSPPYVFLHELGHILHTQLTNKIFVPPESFNFLQSLMFKNLKDAPKKEWAECFSESFAIAAIQGTMFDQPQYFYNCVKKSDKKIMSYYIKVLMDTIDENENGQCSWEDLIYIYRQKHQFT